MTGSKVSNRRPSVVDETTPLMIASEEVPVALSNESNALSAPMEANGNAKQNTVDDDKPLDKLQIFLLSYARLVEPVSFFCIFPFINQMIAETGSVKDDEVGFYSGLIESLFSLTQMCLMIPWGRAADYFGRKPVLVFSLGGLSVATAAFGFSQSLWQMVLARCIAGMFGGVIVTVRTMISENSTPKTQARAFSWFAFASNLGILIGPIVGGVFAKPTTEYPKVFGRIAFFHNFPYALPTLVCGTIGLTAFISCLLLIRETLPSTPSSSTRPAQISMLQILRSPHVTYILTLYSIIMVLAFYYTAIWPVFCFTPISRGGLGFSPAQISLMLSIGGASQSFYMLVVFPPLQHRIGTIGIMRLASFVWPAAYILLPVVVQPLRVYSQSSHGFEIAFWATLVPSMIMFSGVAMSFTAVQLALNDLSPGPTALGTLNAMSLTMTSGVRSFTPALAGAIYATGVKYRILWGQLGWAVLFGVAVMYGVLLRWFPKQAEGWIKKKGDDEEEARTSDEEGTNEEGQNARDGNRRV